MADISILINGKAHILESSGFHFMFQRGLTEFQATYSVKPESADEIFAIANPIDITITDSTTGKTQVIKNLYALKKRHSSEFHSTITLADPRVFLKYMKWTGRYNMKRFANMLQVLPVQNKILKDYFNYPIAIYRSWSIKDGIKLDWKHRIKQTGTPYDVIEIADKILTEVCKVGDESFYGGIRGDEEKFNKVKPDDIESFGDSVVNTLQKLLVYGKATVVFLPDGKIYLQPFDDESYAEYLTPKNAEGGTRIAGKLWVSDNMNQMPSSIDVLFKKEEEVIFEAIELFDNIYTEMLDPNDTQKPILRNVMRIPANMMVNGEEYTKGEWIPLNYVLNEFNCPEKMLRVAWFNSLWIDWFMWNVRGVIPKDYPLDPIGLRLAQTIKESYRKYYQIDPTWYEEVLDVIPNMVSIVDWVTMTRQPSIVMANYMHALRVTKWSKNAANKKLAMNMILAPWGDKAEVIMKRLAERDNNNDEAVISPFTASIADKNAGVFQISVNQDLQFNVYDSMFFTVKESEVPTAEMSSGADGWEAVSQEERHRFFTVMTVIKGMPNDKDQMYKINITPKSLGYTDGKFPKWEIFSQRLNARLDWEGKLVDSDIIEGFAKGEAEKAIWCLKNRLVGSATFGEMLNVSEALTGFVDTVELRERAGGIVTTVRIPEIPPDIDLWSILPPEVMKKAFRQIEV